VIISKPNISKSFILVLTINDFQCYTVAYMIIFLQILHVFCVLLILSCLYIKTGFSYNLRGESNSVLNAIQ